MRIYGGVRIENFASLSMVALKRIIRYNALTFYIIHSHSGFEIQNFDTAVCRGAKTV